MSQMTNESKHTILVAAWHPVKQCVPVILGRFPQKVEPGCRNVIPVEWSGGDETRKSELMEIDKGTQNVCCCPGYALGNESRTRRSPL